MAKDCKTCPYRLQAVFKKPTVEDIIAYAKEIGYTTCDAEYFYHKNESVGWVDNRGLPYKKWKGVLQTWFRAAKRRGEIVESKPSFKEQYKNNDTTQRPDF